MVHEPDDQCSTTPREDKANLVPQYTDTYIYTLPPFEMWLAWNEISGVSQVEKGDKTLVNTEYKTLSRRHRKSPGKNQ